MPVYAQREYEKRRSEINKGRNKIKNNPQIQEEIRRYEESFACFIVFASP